MTLTATAKEKSVQLTELPKKAQQYIATHFKGGKMTSATQDMDFGDRDYTVYMTAKGIPFKLEFDKKGNIEDVESQNNTALPTTVVPAKIRAYITKNYPNNKIVEWSQDGRLQKIELDNDLELLFRKNGTFVKIDR